MEIGVILTVIGRMMVKRDEIDDKIELVRIYANDLMRGMEG